MSQPRQGLHLERLDFNHLGKDSLCGSCPNPPHINDIALQSDQLLSASRSAHTTSRYLSPAVARPLVRSPKPPVEWYSFTIPLHVMCPLSIPPTAQTSRTLVDQPLPFIDEANTLYHESGYVGDALLKDTAWHARLCAEAEAVAESMTTALYILK